MKKDLNSGEWMWMTLDSNARDGGLWKAEFKKWLNGVKPVDISDLDWKNIVTEWQREPDASKRDLEKLFSNRTYATKYANYFGYKWNYANFDSIKDLDISKKQ